MKRLLVLTLAFFLSTIAAFAADLNGAWTGELNFGDAPVQLTFNFKVDGAKLTGNIQSAQGEPLNIENGKVDGDKFSFTVSFNGSTITHTGTLSGDSVKLTTKSEFGDSEMTLKRAVAKPAAN